MERNSRNSQGYKLESQIREAYGKIVYSETCHNKLINRLEKRNYWLRLAQVPLSAASATGLIYSYLSYCHIAITISTLVTMLLLVLQLWELIARYGENINLHKLATDKLWKIREEYVSLLTDFEYLSQSEIILKRDNLQNRTYDVYFNYPRTDRASYLEAQKALKCEEEQTFSDDEIDNLLPNSIRRRNRTITD